MTVKWGVFANFSDNGSEFRCVSMRRDASKRCVTAPSAEQSVQTQSTWADANWNRQHAANKHTLSYGLHGNTTQGFFFFVSPLRVVTVRVEDIPLSLPIIGERQSPDAETNILVPGSGWSIALEDFNVSGLQVCPVRQSSGEFEFSGVKKTLLALNISPRSSSCLRRNRATEFPLSEQKWKLIRERGITSPLKVQSAQQKVRWTWLRLTFSSSGPLMMILMTDSKML